MPEGIEALAAEVGNPNWRLGSGKSVVQGGVGEPSIRQAITVSNGILWDASRGGLSLAEHVPTNLMQERSS